MTIQGASPLVTLAMNRKKELTMVNDFSGLGKVLMVLGAVIMGLGVFFWLGGKIPGIGRLPGDILVKRGNFTFYFPLATCVLLSIVLSVILAWLRRH
jgi:hypothetical protein